MRGFLSRMRGFLSRMRGFLSRMRGFLSGALDGLRRGGPKVWIGWGLFILSFVLYGAIPLVVIMPIPAGFKAGASVALVVLGETSFWVSVALLGRQVLSRFRRYSPRGWLRARLRRETP